jgi:hypothetical protein
MLEALQKQLKYSPLPDTSGIAIASEQGLPDKDAPILAAALAAEARILVTGDRTHFGHLYANDHGGVATTPENERSLRGRQRGEVGQTYGDSIPFANVTRDHCPEPRNASLQSAS